MAEADPQSRRGHRSLLIALAVTALVGVAALVVVRLLTPSARTAPAYEPPVLAGQQLWGSCAGGFYARLGDTIVLTSSGHCTTEGTIAYDADGTVRGVFGPPARDPTCPYPGHKCAASDMNYLLVADDQIPWGHLNLVNFGTGGYRPIASGTAPLGCEDIGVGDDVEFNGRNVHRTGTVAEKGQYLHDTDGDYFPCMIAAGIQVGTGDSGGGVLVRGLPGGVASRSFDGLLGFTPLAEGLAQLGLELCTTPNCDFVPPSADPGIGQTRSRNSSTRFVRSLVASASYDGSELSAK